MTRLKYSLATALLVSGTVSYPSYAATVAHQLGTVTAGAENSCLASTATANGDDCSYNASNPGGSGTSQWIGPTFSAGYYAPPAAPDVFANPAVPAPVSAPASVLPTGGKQGIPAGVILTIDDAGTPADPSDDIIGGSVNFAPFQRNVDLGNGQRAIEKFAYLQFQLVGRKADSATPRSGGGFDYVIGSQGMPDPLTGTTTQGGGFSDQFPSEVASQSSTDTADVPYWSAPGSAGIATFEGNTGATMNPNLTSGAGYTCRTAPTGTASTCPTGNPELWNDKPHATPHNVLMRFSTDATGAITGGTMILVKEFNLADDTSKPSDSWQATTISFVADDVIHLADDNFDLINLAKFGNAYILLALDNDTFLTADVQQAVQILTPPSHGTVTFVKPSFQYTPTAGISEPDSFVYQITDIFGHTASATVTIKGIAAAADSITATVGVPSTIQVLNNDTARVSSAISVSIETPPTYGIAVVNPDNSITYTPTLVTAASFGCDISAYPKNCSFYSSQAENSFRYKIADADGHEATAGITVRISAATATTAGGVPVKILVPATNGGQSGLVSVTILNQPPFGTAVVNSDNSITYTPVAGFAGCYYVTDSVNCPFPSASPDRFRYSATYADNQTSVADVWINVYPNAERKSGSSAMDPLALLGLAFALVPAWRRRARMAN